MLNLKVSKKTWSEASKNKVITKIKHINKLSKSKKIINQNKFSNIKKSTLQKSHVILNWKKNIT